MRSLLHDSLGPTSLRVRSSFPVLLCAVKSLSPPASHLILPHLARQARQDSALRRAFSSRPRVTRLRATAQAAPHRLSGALCGCPHLHSVAYVAPRASASPSAAVVHRSCLSPQSSLQTRTAAPRQTVQCQQVHLTHSALLSLCSRVPLISAHIAED
ncbi:hypothetical protein NDU88_004191 [Pleurodeles waltl]|uniref:Uncharacterized protein n=1 Tax=Pleurodeles waltl TaxID=8319 RepID=A0AAV7NJ21_PLEWA|nr:hypothetical protein NDU88_004191 [Pleurodeles waltl]